MFCSFDNDTARIVISFGADNSSSSHADNCKNNFWVLCEGPTFEAISNFGSSEKNFSINFSKANTKFCLSLLYNTDNSYFFLNGKKSLSLKPSKKMLTFKHSFVLKAYLMDLVPLSLEKYF